MTVSLPIDYQEIFQRAPVGMCISRQRVIHAGNLALAAMFGYTVDQLAGQSFLMLYPSSEEFERIGARIVPIMTSKGSYSDDRIMRRSNGELFWCHVAGRALVPGAPHEAGIWTFEDLSEKRAVRAELTPREREIAALLVEGETSKSIARVLGISPRTVEMHRATLMKKFGAATTAEFVNRMLTA